MFSLIAVDNRLLTIHTVGDTPQSFNRHATLVAVDQSGHRILPRGYSGAQRTLKLSSRYLIKG